MVDSWEDSGEAGEGGQGRAGQGRGMVGGEQGVSRGGSRNSLKGGGGFWARILRRGGGVQVRGNFHILTSKKKGG